LPKILYYIHIENENAVANDKYVVYNKERNRIYLTDTPDKVQWHPSFYGAAGYEFKNNKHDITIVSEYNLSKQPLRIDLLLIIKRNEGKEPVKLENEIGHIMKTYNIIEYKSPDDGMTIDDFYKTLAYACFYKGLGEKVNRIPVGEMTVSLFRESFPREMFKELKKLGFTIREQYPGIYYIGEGLSVLPAIQIVVIKRLSAEKHSALKVLSKNVAKEDIKRFLNEIKLLEDSDDKENADAILQASISANYEMYKEVREEHVMCEALERLMKDKIDEKLDEKYDMGRLAGICEGRREGALERNTESIKNIMTKLSYTAEQAMDLLEIPEMQREIVMNRL